MHNAILMPNWQHQSTNQHLFKLYQIHIIIIIYLLQIVIDNSSQKNTAAEQDKKAQIALTIALKDTYNTVTVQRQL